ncbi:Protein FAR1-RELATED SEQUENCE 5 [Glycine soja]
MNENDHEEEDDNDVIEVYENEHEEEDDARLEDEDEVDCEVQNDDYGDYDDFWIPSLLKDECISFETIVDIRQFDMEKMSVEDVSRLDFAELELAYVFYCWRDKGSTSNTRKRREKKESRCGCETIVFAAAIVTDEIEETYVWLLEQFLETMKGKTPCSIITDGDLAMRNAITRVMAGVFHRLCAWHLLRNALSHVGDKQVLKWLKKLILGDFEVVTFEEKWKEMIATFELEDNSWIGELYEKRMKWSPAHLREQFQRCLTYFRYRVVVADYFSTYGNEVLQTNLRSLERSVDQLLTKEMFILFQSYVSRTIKLRVVDCKEMATFSVYTIVKYYSGSVWRVSYFPSTVNFSCCCMRMQSIGLPCDQILVVLVCLNFTKLPSCLVLNRWSKSATENIKDKYADSAIYWDSQLMARYVTLVQVSREVCEAAYYDEDEYEKILHFLSNEVRRLKSNKNSEPSIDDNDEQQGHNYDDILYPVVVQTKGCGQVGIDESGKRRRIQKYGQCGGSGHNKRSCTNRPRNANFMQQPHTFVASSSRPGP